MSYSLEAKLPEIAASRLFYYAYFYHVQSHWEVIGPAIYYKEWCCLWLYDEFIQHDDLKWFGS
jgi:hypothetical protein